MMKRPLRTALLISLGLHIFAMSAVVIISPEDTNRMRRYTRVDFLGSILRKTAFDIMLENTHPIAKNAHRHAIGPEKNKSLEVKVPDRKSDTQGFPTYTEDGMRSRILNFLRGRKASPDFVSGSRANIPVSKKNTLARQKREVIYKSETPRIARGLYGGKETFKIKLKVLVDSSGNVKKAEPVTTTGYPQLDITASKIVKGWLFEPKESARGRDEWHTAEIVLSIGD